MYQVAHALKDVMKGMGEMAPSVRELSPKVTEGESLVEI